MTGVAPGTQHAPGSLHTLGFLHAPGTQHAPGFLHAPGILQWYTGYVYRVKKERNIIFGSSHTASRGA